MPYSMNIFNQIRQNDINLEFAISDTNQTLTYYEFNEPALNGFCDEVWQKKAQMDCMNIKSSPQKIRIYRLDEILPKSISTSKSRD
ncbi:hypothetical protein [Nostoc sp.]